VWINGADGASHDFELLSAPRIGDRVSIAAADHVEEGIVATVNWHLQALESNPGMSLEGEPAGSVTMVHVICSPTAEVIRGAFEEAELPEPVEDRRA